MQGGCGPATLIQEFFQGQEFVPDGLEQGQHLVVLGGMGKGLGWQAVLLRLMVHLAAHGRQAQFFLLPQALDLQDCLLYTSPSPRDGLLSRMPSSA